MPGLIDEKYSHAAAQFKEHSSSLHPAYQEWHKKVNFEGVLDKKTKELISLGVSCAIRCSYCIDAHAQKAISHGATKEEVAEVIHIAALINAGSAISYGVNAFQYFKE